MLWTYIILQMVAGKWYKHLRLTLAIQSTDYLTGPKTFTKTLLLIRKLQKWLKITK